MDHRVISLHRALSPRTENIVVLSITGSTHAMARRLIDDMDDEKRKLGPTVIIAHQQDSGEGRGGHSWQAAAHGLFLNWLQSGITGESLGLLPMLAAASARRALAAVGVANTGIKWPNDILVDGMKIAGLLVFARHGEKTWVSVGLGINLVSAPVISEAGSPRATAVADHRESGDIEDWRYHLAGDFIRHLHQSIDEPGTSLAEWRAHLIQKPGDEVSIRLGSEELVTGTVTEVTKEGFLRIQGPDGERLITGGDLVES